MKRLLHGSVWFLVIAVVTSCATYYQSNIAFNQVFEKGDLQDALKTLRARPSDGAGKKQFLYLVNNGLILSLLGRYNESNNYFEKAYNFGEDYHIDYLNQAASYLTNPNFTVYRGEDHEHLLLLYYKAINYLKLKKIDEALVECRRLNIRLQQLSDRYTSENKYRSDAFVNTLMGIIYETDRDYNNAFIAYRNAYEVYETDFRRLFGIGAPEQLKIDLLRMANLSGMEDDFEKFKIQFGMPDFQVKPRTGGELVFFWNNGLSPIKREWSINFVISRNGDQMTFFNREMGMSFPFDMSGYSDSDRKALTNLEVYRLTFPRYMERPLYFKSATLMGESGTYPVQLLEDVNKIAFKCLDERMHLELSKALLRVALKKATENQLRKENEGLGALMGVLNAITEKADTRNWQTLPHSISYARIPLKKGLNEVVFTTTDEYGRSLKHPFTYEVKKSETLFHTFTSLESVYPPGGYY
ncbi:MAG: hypothetical protein SH819_00255 [Cytophagales bacterium]|nr:hypothetical protein [Cytophagales bacterium]